MLGIGVRALAIESGVGAGENPVSNDIYTHKHTQTHASTTSTPFQYAIVRMFAHRRRQRHRQRHTNLVCEAAALEQ